MSAIFGPAGNAESFPYKSSADAPRWLAELGLDCYEYQCGKGVNVREETARNIGAAAVAAGKAARGGGEGRALLDAAEGRAGRWQRVGVRDDDVAAELGVGDGIVGKLGGGDAAVGRGEHRGLAGDVVPRDGAVWGVALPWGAVRFHETDARVEDAGLAFLAASGDDERLRGEMSVCHRYHLAFSTANAFGSSTA